MDKKYTVLLETDLSIDEVDKIINWQDQGWYGCRNESYHSLMLTLRKEVTIVTNRIEEYVEAMEKLMFPDLHIVSYWEEEEK